MYGKFAWCNTCENKEMCKRFSEMSHDDFTKTFSNLEKGGKIKLHSIVSNRVRAIKGNKAGTEEIINEFTSALALVRDFSISERHWAEYVATVKNNPELTYMHEVIYEFKSMLDECEKRIHSIRSMTEKKESDFGFCDIMTCAKNDETELDKKFVQVYEAYIDAKRNYVFRQSSGAIKRKSDFVDFVKYFEKECFFGKKKNEMKLDKGFSDYDEHGNKNVVCYFTAAGAAKKKCGECSEDGCIERVSVLFDKDKASTQYFDSLVHRKLEDTCEIRVKDFFKKVYNMTLSQDAHIDTSNDIDDTYMIAMEQVHSSTFMYYVQLKMCSEFVEFNHDLTCSGLVEKSKLLEDEVNEAYLRLVKLHNDIQYAESVEKNCRVR